VTSMQKELGREVPLQDVAHAVTRQFGSVFESQILWLETLEDLSGPQVGVPVKAPPEIRRITGEGEIFRA